LLDSLSGAIIWLLSAILIAEFSGERLYLRFSTESAMLQFLKTRDLLRAVVYVVASLSLTACGQKGDLYLPAASQLLNKIIF